MAPVALTILLATIASQTSGLEPFRAQAGVSRGPHFVGETIDLVVRASSSDGRPAIVPPRPRGARLRAAGTDVQPISTSAIGDTVHEYNRYLYRYQLTVESAGTFTLPPFQLRAGSRSTATSPLRLTIRPIPSNRPATFLGGVGPIQVEVEATPASIMLGQRLEYRVTVTGPGSQWIRQPPTLERLKRLSIAPTVTLLSDERVELPPKRLFRYEVRPTKPGDVTLPPLALSSFDPRTQQFPVSLSRSIPIRVSARTGEQVLGDLPDTRTFAPWWSRRDVQLAITATSVFGLGLAAFVGVRAVGRRRAGRFQPGRWCREKASQLETAGEGQEIAREITDSLAEFLHLAIARPTGALTPAEACAGIMETVGSAELADEAANLVRDCDACRFDAGRPADALKTRASRFFASLGRELSAWKHRERHSQPPQ